MLSEVELKFHRVSSPLKFFPIELSAHFDKK